MARILSIDLGTKCGWAMQDGSRKLKYGTLNLTKNHHFDGAGMVFLTFRRWLEQQRPLDMVAFEAVMAHDARAVHAQHRYGGLLAVLQEFGCEHGIPHVGFGVGEIKKHWTGNGKASKEAMISECRNRGFNPRSEDEADAIAIAHLAEDCYGLLL